MRGEITPTRHGANSNRKKFFLADKRCEAYAFKPLSLWKRLFLLPEKPLIIKLEGYKPCQTIDHLLMNR
jgi:hypothetical protein